MSDYGDVVLQLRDPGPAGRVGPKPGWQELWVLEAAPRSLVAEELLEQVRRGDGRPEITLDGEVLTIRAVNRIVVYRIVGRHPDWLNYPDVWVIEWPD